MLMLFLLATHPVFAQTDTAQDCKLLLVYDTPQKAPHLSFIEESLRVLVYSGGEQKQVFCNVSNMNSMQENLKNEADLTMFIKFVNPQTSLYTPPTQARQERDLNTTNLLTGFGQLMKVTVTPSEGGLLYTFQLYKVLSPPGEIPVLEPYGSADQLINPADKLAPQQLMRSIKNVCRVSNAPPSVRLISVNGIKQTDFYSIAVDDTLLIEPEINDADSPPENMMCRWFCKPLYNSIPLKFTVVSPTFLSFTSDSGTYLIWTKVNDRINEVNSDTLKIVFVHRPEIISSPDSPKKKDKYESKTIYQSYLHFGSEEPIVVDQKYYKLQLRRRAKDIRFGFEARWMPDGEEKDRLNQAFRITNHGEYYLIDHQAKTKNAGSYRFFVTAYDRGIASGPGVFTARYYKAWPVYFTVGTAQNRVFNYKPASLYHLTLGFGAYMKHRIIFDFTAEVPMTDSADIQRAHTYPRNWRAGIIYELFGKHKSLFAGPELDFLYLYYPWNSRQGYFGCAIGLHLRARYLAKHWSLYFRPQMGYLKDFPQEKNHTFYWSTQFGFAFQPVVKGKTYR
jgi:hypothetical protein